MLTDTQLKKRDQKRNIGQELLAAVQEMAAGQWSRKTTYKILPDGSVRRTVMRDILVADQESSLGKYVFD